jgi:tetratricopeptide (TPR) repeat protein
LEKTRGPQTRTESKTRLVEQINLSLRSGDYARALDLLRGTGTEFSNDAELSELKQRAEDGVKCKAEADRLITESQELFAQQKAAEAIQLLRKAYELDKNNSVARAILANALVEHANSLVESDWLEAEKLSNQALALNPAHPTAKTILSLIVQKKETSSVEDWVSQARKLHSSGDLFAALAWVAEGLAVHPHHPRLLQVQDAVQRDQETRRRQARRGDLDELRRLQQEIAGATDVAAKQALVERIQAVAAKHWTDGEILSIANALLLRLGMLPQESSTASARRKGATVIFHVPRPNAPEAPRANTSQISTSPVVPTQVPSRPVASEKAPTGSGTASAVPQSVVPQSKIPSTIVPPDKVSITPGEPKPVPSPAVTVPAAEPSAPAAKVKSPSSQPKQPTRSKSIALIVISAAAMILMAAIFFFARKHQAPPVAQNPAAAPTVSAPTVSPPTPAVSAPAVSAPEQTNPEPSAAAPESSDADAGNVTPDNPPAPETGRNVGTLLVVAGQDDARVFLNGRLQRQLTHAGELRILNLELKDYVVRVSKNGFQDPPQQKIRIHNGEEARLIFNLQPQPPRMASLTIQGGAPGTTVLVDQNPVGSIQSDGTLSVSSINPGDHSVELRKERFKPRQLKKHFVAGGSISLAAADATLEPAPAELKVTFTPADANVAIVKGDLLKMVSSGVPLNLDPGTYTLTARTADRFTRSAAIEVIAGQSKTLNLSLAPNSMSKWEDPSAWKQEGDSFSRKGGDFVLYGVVPASGTFVFSAMLTKGHLLQWVLNYTDPKNYVLLQIDDNNYYRSVIHNGEKTDEIIVPHKGEKKALRTLRIRVSPTELVHQLKKGDSWTVLDRWTQPGTNLSLGKFGFYVPGNDQVTLSGFAHYADLNIH